VAVTFFFVLSGFVLTWACVDDEGRVSSGRRYAASRLARLLPVHALSVLVVAPVAVGLWRRAHQGGGGDFGLDVALPGLLVALNLQAWHPATALAWNPPAWSLSVEVAFSALFPFLAPRFVARRWRGASLIAGALLVVAFAPGVAALVVAPADFDVGPAAHGVLVDAWRYHPLLRLPEFIAGVAAACALRAGVVAPPRLVVGAVVVVVGVVGLTATGVVPVVLVHNGLFAPAFAVWVLALATARGRGVRLLSSTPLRLLGDASYALYLLHVPALYWFVAIAERRGHARVLDDPRHAALAALACVGLAVLAHVLFERPARRALQAALRTTQETTKETTQEPTQDRATRTTLRTTKDTPPRA
jgi:peptidoglycan/LPS O-acetylase OafA/YrhL